MHRVSKIYPPNKKVLENISISYYYGAKIGVLGLNGAGKSTFMKIMAGLDLDFLGNATLTPGLKMGYLAQEPKLDEEKTVKENVLAGMGEVAVALEKFNAINEKFADPDLAPEAMEKLLEEQAKLQEKIESMGGWEIDHKLDMAMDALRLPPPDAVVKNLSGGERRRVALCKLLLQKPDILLLDEPTNHLDAETVEWLEKFLHKYEGTVIAVTHDRYFLDNVAGWILELDRGQGIPWEGNYTSWLEQKQKRLAVEEKQETKRQKTLEKELEWVRMSPRARQAKNKARVGAYEKLLAESSKEKIEEVEIFIPPGPRLGNTVIDIEGVSKTYGDKVLFENLTFKIPPASIVGIIGPNGVGKTTLFRIITGQEKPETGHVRLGDTVKLGYVDQMRDSLDPDKTVWEEISNGDEVITLGNRDVQSRSYCARFNFSGNDQQKKVGSLSGGERNRLHLAKMLKSGANVLLLDEPTNDLDVNTLRALEEALLGFAGCALVISHDRWFLDRICTHILSFEGIDSKVEFFTGNYQDYLEDKRRRLGDAALQPKRVKFKRLTK